jgi:maleate isomerase
MLTPSSNTVLEPFTAAMLQGVPNVTAHFARFRVLKISLDSDALSQFSPEPMLLAADLLADAKVNVICWNGTSAGWLGFDTDETLCSEIRTRTGKEACSSVLALNEKLKTNPQHRIAFVTPYLDSIQNAIIKNYTEAGFEVVAERHLGDPGNYSFSDYSEDQIAAMCNDVAMHNPQAICVFCTNFRGATIAERIEKETGIPVYDTVSTAVWKSLKVVGADTTMIKGWGSIFDVN